MSKFRARSIAFALGFPLAVLMAPSVQAAEPGLFGGKRIMMYSTTNPGGGFDLYNRLVARHIGPHIPGNPNVAASNMTGAGGLQFAELDGYVWHGKTDVVDHAAVARGARRALEPREGDPPEGDPVPQLVARGAEVLQVPVHRLLPVRRSQVHVVVGQRFGLRPGGRGAGQYAEGRGGGDRQDSDHSDDSIGV